MPNHNLTAIILSSFVFYHPSALPMSNEPLAITVQCRENPTCMFDGRDITLDIAISNQTNKDVLFPLKYLEARGPAVMLVDALSGERRPLRISLAPAELKKEFHVIKSGQTVSVDTIISRYDIGALRQDFVNLTAVVSPAVDIRFGQPAEVHPFRGEARVRIVDQRYLDRHQEFPRK